MTPFMKSPLGSIHKWHHTISKLNWPPSLLCHDKIGVLLTSSYLSSQNHIPPPLHAWRHLWMSPLEDLKLSKSNLAQTMILHLIDLKSSCYSKMWYIIKINIVQLLTILSNIYNETFIVFIISIRKYSSRLKKYFKVLSFS